MSFRGAATSDQPAGDAEVAELGETQYLDMDRDGVPDGVRTTATVEYELQSGSGVVETIEEIASGIGVDGMPGVIELSDTVLVDVDRDGTDDVAESIVVVVHTEPRDHGR